MAEQGDQYVLTIDAGTGSGRALVFDDQANQIAAAQREWTLLSLPEHPGSAVFDTDLAWELICQCIREVIDAAGITSDDIAAVSATSMREGMVLYDGDRREIWACPNIDARARDEAEQLVRDGLDEPIYRTGGDGLGIISPPRFRWIARHQPEIFEQTRHMSMISDWVLFRLSGKIATDPSCGSSSGLFDLKTGDWSRELIDTLNLPDAIFPPVKLPGTVLGQITKQAATQTRLAAGTPVVVGGADTQLALLGTGGTRAGQLTVVGGTFWQTAWLADRPLIDDQCRLRTLCHVVPDLWMTEGIGFLNGLAMRWVRDTVRDSLSTDAYAKKQDPYAKLESLAEQIPPGAGGVFALVSDVMNARRWIQAPMSFIGLDVTNPHHAGDRGKGLMVRAVQESAAFTALAHYRILESLSGQSAASLMFCGGASKGRLWPQIMADVFDMSVHVPMVKETTSLGAAMCALVGIGRFSSLPETAEALVRVDRTVEPNPERVAAYRAIAKQATDLQRGVIEWVETGRLKEMWRAAGVPALGSGPR